MPVTPATVDRLLEILQEQYIVYVKKAILWLEVETGEKSKRSIYELKDALDHIAIAVHPDTTEDHATMHLNAVEEHFRRAAVEPAEWLALNELNRLLKIKNRGFWWWKFLLLKAPEPDEFDKTILAGQELVTKGREYKAISLQESFKHLKEGCLVFRKLRIELQPSELRSRVFAILLAIIFFVLGIIATVVIS